MVNDLARAFVAYHKKNHPGISNYVNIVAIRQFASDVYDATALGTACSYTRPEFIAEFLEEVSFLLEK